MRLRATFEGLLKSVSAQGGGLPSGYSISTFGGAPLTYNGAAVLDNNTPSNLSVRTQ